MENLNQQQLKILVALLFNPKARFRDLNTEKLDTDHFSYHLRSLIATELIKKDGTFYCLTAKGKMAASRLDTVSKTVEKQPKVSVILIPRRGNKFLVQQRMKEPYFGYWGFMVGKVKFGETLDETARRELLEEAGINGKFRFCYEIHEMVYDKTTGSQLEDKFFQVMEAYDLVGEPATSNEGINKFVTKEEFKKLIPKYHNEQDLFEWYLKKDFKFKEEKYFIEKF